VTRRFRWITLATLAWVVTLLAVPTGPAAPQPAPGPFDARLKEIAAEYVRWGRVDHDARWGPEFCRAPIPAMARFSESGDAKSHGRKLYSLFARERPAYVNAARKATPIGQAIVKESWVPEEVPDDGRDLREKAIHDQKAAGDSKALAEKFVPFARRDGKLFKAAKQADLFVMMKLDPNTPDTDAGWVYGTVTPDGTQVTSAGRVDSCMRCHVKAEHDRLFGLPAAK
jgi:hypothetical protein